MGKQSAYWGFPLVHADASYAHSGTNALRFGTPDRDGKIAKVRRGYHPTLEAAIEELLQKMLE